MQYLQEERGRERGREREGERKKGSAAHSSEAGSFSDPEAKLPPSPRRVVWTLLKMPLPPLPFPPPLSVQGGMDPAQDAWPGPRPAQDACGGLCESDSGGGGVLPSHCLCSPVQHAGGRGGEARSPNLQDWPSSPSLAVVCTKCPHLVPFPPPRSGRLVLVGGEQPSSLLVFPVTHLAPFPCR